MKARNNLIGKTVPHKWSQIVTIRKRSKNIRQANKGTQIKVGTKKNPKNSTRIRLQNKKQHHWKIVVGQRTCFSPIQAELPFWNLPLKIDMQDIQDLN